MGYPYLTIENYTATSNGAMPLLFSIRDGVPYAFDALLLVVFLVLTASQYFIGKNKSGRGKIFISILTSSIIMIILSLLLSMSQLVSFMEPVFYAFVAIVFFALSYISDSW